jgi:hypothetical protein
MANTFGSMRTQPQKPYLFGPPAPPATQQTPTQDTFGGPTATGPAPGIGGGGFTAPVGSPQNPVGQSFGPAAPPATGQTPTLGPVGPGYNPGVQDKGPAPPTPGFAPPPPGGAQNDKPWEPSGAPPTGTLTPGVGLPPPPTGGVAPTTPTGGPRPGPGGVGDAPRQPRPGFGGPRSPIRFFG